MNLVRGFDRIALVLVLIMLSPGFYLGVQLSGKLLKTESREYRAWHKQYEEQEKELENEVKGLSKAEVSEKIKKMPARTHKSDSLSKLFNNPSKNPKGFYVQLRLSELWKNKPQTKYIQSSHAKQIFAASMFAALQSFLVLILLMILIRGIHWTAKAFVDR
jgi:hypothetical protein